MLQPKIKILKSYGLSDKKLRDAFIKYPKILTKGNASIRAKLFYISKYSKMDFLVDPAFPGIILKSFKSCIKPRGEIMLKKGETNWGPLFNLSDIEFCTKMGCTQAQLDKEKIPQEDIGRDPEVDIKITEKLGLVAKELKNSIYKHPVLS